MLEPHFTNIKGVILSQVSQAENSIYACVAWFTDADLLAALCRRAESGVSVALMIYRKTYPDLLKLVKKEGED